MSKLILCDTDDTVLLTSDALEAFCEEKLGMKSHKRLRDTIMLKKYLILIRI